MNISKSSLSSRDQKKSQSINLIINIILNIGLLTMTLKDYLSFWKLLLHKKWVMKIIILLC